MTMTDLTPNEADSQIVSWYKKLMSQVNVIDEKLDASSESATKTKYKNELISKYEPQWKTPVVDKLTPQLDEMDIERLAGNYYGIINTLTKAYKEKVDAWLTNQIESMPVSETETMSDDDKKALAKERSEVAKQIKTIVDMAVTFNEAEASNPWPLPKSRRGSVGKRGPRALSSYTWTIDGVAPTGKQDSLKGVSELLGFSLQKDLTAALKAAGINTTEPPEEFTAVINDKQVIGTKRVEDEGEDEEDEEEDDE